MFRPRYVALPPDAQAAIEPLSSSVPARSAAPQENTLTVPDSTCPIVLRLQPFYESALPHDADLFNEAPTSSTGAPVDTNQGVSFLVWWVDPTYRLSHATISQAIPAWWCTCYSADPVTVPLEHNVWVEQAMCDAIEGALAVVAQVSWRPSRCTDGTGLRAEPTSYVQTGYFCSSD